MLEKNRMTKKLLPYGEARYSNLVSKLGHGGKAHDRVIGDKTVTAVLRRQVRGH
jgi:hypothetical protein